MAKEENRWKKRKKSPDLKKKKSFLLAGDRLRSGGGPFSPSFSAVTPCPRLAVSREEEKEPGADPADRAHGDGASGQPPGPLPALWGPRCAAQPGGRAPRQRACRRRRALPRRVQEPQPAAVCVQRQHPHLLPADACDRSCQRVAGGRPLGRESDREGHLREVLVGREGALRTPGRPLSPQGQKPLIPHLGLASPNPWTSEGSFSDWGGRGCPRQITWKPWPHKSWMPFAIPAPSEWAFPTPLWHELGPGEGDHQGPAPPEHTGRRIRPEVRLGCGHEGRQPGAAVRSGAPRSLLLL